MRPAQTFSTSGLRVLDAFVKLYKGRKPTRRRIQNGLHLTAFIRQAWPPPLVVRCDKRNRSACGFTAAHRDARTGLVQDVYTHRRTSVIGFQIRSAVSDTRGINGRDNTGF
jgi:hypothetical protein